MRVNRTSTIHYIYLYIFAVYSPRLSCSVSFICMYFRRIKHPVETTEYLTLAERIVHLASRHRSINVIIFTSLYLSDHVYYNHREYFDV